MQPHALGVRDIIANDQIHVCRDRNFSNDDDNGTLIVGNDDNDLDDLDDLELPAAVDAIPGEESGDAGDDNKSQESDDDYSDVQLSRIGSSKEFESNLHRKMRIAYFRFPRLYSTVLKIALPMNLLICIIFGCGAWLVHYEASPEMGANNAAASAHMRRTMQISQLSNFATSSVDACIDSFELPDTSTSIFDPIESVKASLKAHTQKCTQQFYTDIERELMMFSRASAMSDADFQWNTCFDPEHGRTMRGVLGQFDTFFSAWKESYANILNRLLTETDGGKITKERAQSIAMAEATGQDACKANNNGGATFWFVLMTTIGYGNAVPVTDEGRALVFTIGFLSILIFTAVIGQAGYILATIVDDVFSRSRFQQIRALKNGIPSVILWFLIFVGDIFLNAAIYRRNVEEFTGQAQLWKDALWFSYISLTTVGFGDRYIRHDIRTHWDLIKAPNHFLFGFILLGTFLTKMSVVLIERVNRPGFAFTNLEKVLEDRRDRGKF